MNSLNRSLYHFSVFVCGVYLSGCALVFNNQTPTVADSGTTKSCTSSETVSVSAAYAGSPNWGDFLLVDGNYHSLSATACTSATDSNCINGGILRKVSISSETSCSGLTGSDTLGVFEWNCYDGGGTVEFYSTQFNSGKGLADLLEDTSFKSIAFQVSNGSCTVYKSEASTTWWTNVIEELPDSSAATYNLSAGNGHSAGTIFVQPIDSVSYGYIISLNRLSIVTLESAVISAHGSLTANCAGAGTAGTDFVGMFCGGSREYTWLEVNIDDSAKVTDRVIHFNNSDHNRIHNTTIRDANGISLVVSNGNGNRTKGSRFISSEGAQAVWILTETYFRADEIRVDNASGYGIYFSNCDNCYINKLISANNGNNALLLDNGCSGSVGTEVLVANRTVYIQGGASPVTLHASSVLNSSGDGISLQGDDVALTSVVLANNANSGAMIFANNTIGAQIVAASNGVYGINTSGNNGRYYSDIVVGNNGSDGCNVTGAGNWLEDITCNHGDGAYGSASVAGTIDNMYTGLVSTDSANAHLTTQAYAALTDWTTFETFFRAWGRSTLNNWTHSDYRGSCTAGNCQIFDYRLSTKDGTGLTTYNGTFTAGSACPASVDPSNSANSITDGIGNTYLLNAVERVFDFIGDDDGLCETGEACIFHPSFGHYLGGGSLSTETCSFTDGGGFSGVKMYGYSEVEVSP